MNLLDKMKEIAKKSKKSLKAKLNPNSPFNTLSDEEILLVLSLRAKKLRIHQNTKQKEFSKKANLSSSSTYSNFEQTGFISLLNFVKIVRTFGRLDELENLLNLTISDKIEETKTAKKRVV